MFVGFFVKHVAKKAMTAGVVLTGAALMTDSGRKIAKVAGAAIAAGIKGAVEAVKKQK